MTPNGATVPCGIDRRFNLAVVHTPTRVDWQAVGSTSPAETSLPPARQAQQSGRSSPSVPSPTSTIISRDIPRSILRCRKRNRTGGRPRKRSAGRRVRVVRSRSQREPGGRGCSKVASRNALPPRSQLPLLAPPSTHGGWLDIGGTALAKALDPGPH
jgi:hypothetical protein